MTDIEKKSLLIDQHEAARDGRKAHVASTAPYGTEEHMNEEQTKRETVEKDATELLNVVKKRFPA